MTDELTWYLSRTTGLLAWALLGFATLWGLLLTSRLLERRPSPAWLLDLHRHLGNLTLALTGVHVGAIVVDDFVTYTPTEVLVPFTSDLDTTAVALGTLGLWTLVVIQATSWLRSRIAPSLWRGIHYLSAPLFVVVGAHALLVGTDVTVPVVAVIAMVVTAEIVLVAVLRVRFGRRPLPAVTP